MSTESAGEDDVFGTDHCQSLLLSVLGRARRDRVLAGLYMSRSDSALLVRQAALHVWKVVVAHTPRTLRDVMSTLFQLLLGCLASPSPDKRQVTRAVIIIIIIIIKGIYIAQVRMGHKCAMSAEMAVWLRNCLYLYSYSAAM